MPAWWAKIKSLFAETEHSSPSQPAIHELINRSDEHLAEFEIWKNGPRHKKMLNLISENYALYQNEQPGQHSAIDWLHTPSTKGLAIHYKNLDYNTEDARFLLDYFKEEIRKQEYRTQVSDTRTYTKQTWVETVERHYLKPRPQYDELGKIDQAFGNITLLLTLRDEQVYNLKVSTTAYQDRLFNAEKQFSELMRVITF